MLKNFRVGFLLVALTACGGLGMDVDSPGASVATESSSDESSAAASSHDLLEGVQEIAIDDSGRGVWVPESVSQEDKFVVMLTQFNPAEAVSNVQIGGEGVSSGGAPAALSKFSSDVTEDFHAELREAESALEFDTSEAGAQSLVVVKSADVGDTKSFYVLNSLSRSAYATVSASLIFQSENINVYLDKRNASALDTMDIESAFNTFNAIIDEERALFGRESDIDGDGRFNILLSQVVNEIGAAGGGIVTGFFYAGDLMSQSYLPKSNQQEIIYTLIPDPAGEFGWPVPTEFFSSNLLPSVLPHEFQHMISFNQHVLETDGMAESTFLNEGLSHLAEDIYSVNSHDYMEKTGLENPARVAGYLRHSKDLCFVCGATLYQRGGSYLFLRYLYEQAEAGNLKTAENGRALLTALTETTLTGMDNIKNAVLADGDEMAELLKLYGLAVYLSDTGLTSDSHYLLSGLALRSVQNDHRGTVLSGPAVVDVSKLPHRDTLAPAGLGYYLINASTLEASGGALELEVENSAQTRATVLQL